MTMVKIRLPEDQLDITSLNVFFDGRPVVSASAAVIRGFGGELDDLGEALREYFVEGASWCRVGDDVHTVTADEFEVRLSSSSGTSGWHVDHFHAGWCSPEGKLVPEDARPQYARYVDSKRRVRESCLEGEDLRAAAAKGGPPRVDELVRRHAARLAEWYDALDELLRAVTTASGLPAWVKPVVRSELLDWHRTREYLTSAVLDYHHGDPGPRPDTVFGNLCFGFSTTAVELMPDV
ncbi:hypothetical protein [Streptomyces sp. NPDC047315]|uniref:hypothetical protein n=1 Tax=Streptomyces sp. NPDC047315 TaxID=3155142 RepID=UPI003403A88D